MFELKHFSQAGRNLSQLSEHRTVCARNIGWPALEGFRSPRSRRTPDMYAGSLLAFTTKVGKFSAPTEAPFMNALKKYLPAVVGDVTWKSLMY